MHLFQILALWLARNAALTFVQRINLNAPACPSDCRAWLGDAGGLVRSFFVVVLMGAVMSACAPTARMEWQRIDGLPPAQSDFQQALQECRGQAETAAANSPEANYPYINLLAVAKGQGNQTLEAAMQSCMSKRGYVSVQVPNKQPCDAN